MKRFYLYILTVAIAITNTSIAHAVTYEQYLSDQRAQHYNKNFVACKVATLELTTADAATNEKTIFQYFIGKELTAEQAAGIVGNFGVETGGTYDPKINQVGGGPGRGIAQWTVTERWVQLVQQARNQGRSEWDLGMQLDFVWYELQNNRKAAYTDLIKQTTVEGATKSFMDLYEQPGTPHFDKRLEYANAAFTKYKDLSGISSASSGDCGVGGGSIVKLALDEESKNITEDPPGCDTNSIGESRNTPGSCGAEIDKYTDTMQEFWCADFVSWVYYQAGTPLTGGLSGGWRIPSVSNMQTWFETNGIFFTPDSTTESPQPGDVVIYSYSHTDIVVAVTDTEIVTVGGNTTTGNSNNGSGVGKHTKSKSQSTIVGYGRMK